MQLLPNGISGHQAKVELTLSDVASLLTDIGTSLPARKRAIAEVAGMGGEHGRGFGCAGAFRATSGLSGATTRLDGGGGRRYDPRPERPDGASD